MTEPKETSLIWVRPCTPQALWLPLTPQASFNSALSSVLIEQGILLPPRSSVLLDSTARKSSHRPNVELPSTLPSAGSCFSKKKKSSQNDSFSPVLFQFCDATRVCKTSRPKSLPKWPFQHLLHLVFAKKKNESIVNTYLVPQCIAALYVCCIVLYLQWLQCNWFKI